MRLSDKYIEKLYDITLTDFEFENGETKNWDIIVETLIDCYEQLEEEFKEYKEQEDEEIPLF